MVRYKAGITIACWVLGLFVLGTGASAQVQAIGLEVAPEDVGFAGFVRPGTWAPLRVRVENRSGQPRQVRCQWLLKDADGDQIYTQRRMTLSPGRTQTTFLYAVPAITTTRRSEWRIRVLDDKTSRVLDSQTINPQQVLTPLTSVIGTTTVRTMGFAPYMTRQVGQIDYGTVTQHEPVRVITGVSEAHLPDRWYGLAIADALVWTPGSGESVGADASGGMHRSRAQALRTWVMRGGHLVVALPAVGDPWDELPIDDLLPPLRIERISDIPPPIWLGGPTPTIANQRVSIDAWGIELADQNDARGSALLHDGAGRGLVWAFRVGFGRVTLIGIDLTEHRLAKLGLPNGNGLWSSVFDWQSPAYQAQYLEREIKDRKIGMPHARHHVMLDRFIPRQVAMRETAAPALLAALITFGIYWLVAGPIGFAVLRSRRLQHHSWVVFLGVVTGFSLLCWGGALAMRPARAQIAHFSVVDMHVDEPSARVRSWLSIFVPTHGRVSVRIGSDDAGSASPGGTGGTGGGNTLASPGWDRTGSDASFVDPQWYQIDAASPQSVQVPIRATAKQFEVDYVGRLGRGYERAESIKAVSPIRVTSGWPTGTLTHRLTGALTNVRVLYCPGGSASPWIWQPTAKGEPWETGEELQIVPPKQAAQLVRTARLQVSPRQWEAEGYLGRLIAAKTGQIWGAPTAKQELIAGNEIVQAIEMLSFYRTLPPPDFRNVNNISANYDRSIGRLIDLTNAISTRSLIVIGHLEVAPLPVPVVVGQKQIDSRGWTVIRWVCPIASDKEP